MRRRPGDAFGIRGCGSGEHADGGAEMSEDDGSDVDLMAGRHHQAPVECDVV